MSVEPRYRRVFLYDENGDPFTLLNPLPVEATTTTGDFVFDVDDNNIAINQVPQTTNSLNYGFEDTEGHWTRFLTEYDNDDIPAGQRPQLENCLMYYYDDKGSTWHRWRGDSGSVWTYVTNFPDTDYRDDGLFTVGSNRGVAIGGIATSDSVNPDDFGVLKITTDRSLVVTNDNITDGTQKTQTVDSNGNATNENIVSTGNSTSTPLNAGITFTGEWVDTLNFGTCIIGVISDKDSATDGLKIEYSDNGTDIIQDDEFTILANRGKVFTVGMANRYLRVKYTNGSDAQGSFSLQTILKSIPIKNSSHRINDSIVAEDDAELVKAVLTGVNPDGVFTNVETTYDNSLKTSLIDGEIGTRAEVEPLGALKVETPVRLVGTTFTNGTKDPNFWTEAVTNGGTVTQAGKITLSTNTTANGTAKYYTVNKARKITGTTNQFRCVAGLTTDAQANNIRRIGAYDINEGFFFQANGTTMQVGSRKSGSDTLVSSGSFNGNYGTEWLPSTNTLYRLIILYTAASAKFFVNGTLLHTIFNTVTGYTNTLTLPVTMENINSGGNTTNNEFVVQFATILRLGNLITNPTSKYLTTGTHVLKYGAGVLTKIIVGDNVGGSVTVYDNTAASGTLLTVLDTAVGSSPLGDMDYNVPFSDGLTIVIVGTNKITIVYE